MRHYHRATHRSAAPTPGVPSKRLRWEASPATKMTSLILGLLAFVGILGAIAFQLLG